MVYSVLLLFLLFAVAILIAVIKEEVESERLGKDI